MNAGKFLKPVELSKPNAERPMPIPNLTIIGESINDSVPSTHQLFEDMDLEKILELAKLQDEKGAAYIDINVGRRSPEFMADLVRKIQQVTSKPLSIDTPDPEIAAAGLEAYDLERAGGKRPILNSISPTRTGMFDLFRIRPFIPILLVTERLEAGGAARMNHTAEETHRTAVDFLRIAAERMDGFAGGRCIIDPGIMPIGSDLEGNFKRLMESIRLIHGDPVFAGVSMSVGLSNFTVMLPSKCGDGSPVRGPLESAFLTLAMPLGLDTVIGSVKRNYQILPDGHPAMRCLKDILQLEGYDVVTRVIDFYS
jgi:cobalamin-dependent methionine synthase I